MAKRRILFLDNRPEFMHQPVLRLRMEGYEVDEVSSGDEALEALRAGPFELLVVDAELPGSGGWEVVKDVRADPDLKDTKVLVLMAAEGETANLTLVRVDAELRRPFRMEQLLETVKEVMEG